MDATVDDVLQRIWQRNGPIRLWWEAGRCYADAMGADESGRRVWVRGEGGTAGEAAERLEEELARFGSIYP